MTVLCKTLIPSFYHDLPHVFLAVVDSFNYGLLIVETAFESGLVGAVDASLSSVDSLRSESPRKVGGVADVRRLTSTRAAWHTNRVRHRE
jgi:hypothetical protein